MRNKFVFVYFGEECNLLIIRAMYSLLNVNSIMVPGNITFSLVVIRVERDNDVMSIIFSCCSRTALRCEHSI